MNLPQHKPRDGHWGRRPLMGPNARVFGLEYLIAVASSRFLRGGPRTIAHLTACVAFFLLIIKMLSLSESAIVLQRTLATPSKTWVWTTEVEVADGPTGIRGISQTSVHGTQKGLRIVVFGQDDAATPGRTNTTTRGTRMPAWTDIMCDEVRTYLPTLSIAYTNFPKISTLKSSLT